jgi:flagellar biosynthesis protein FliP
MIPFFVGDIIDIFHRANTQNMRMIQGFVDGDETVVKQVNQRAWQSAIVLFILLLLIALMIGLLISFGSYLYSVVSSIFLIGTLGNSYTSLGISHALFRYNPFEMPRKLPYFAP